MITPAEVDKMDIEVMEYINKLEDQIDNYIKTKYQSWNDPYVITIKLDKQYNDTTMYALLRRYYESGWNKIYFKRHSESYMDNAAVEIQYTYIYLVRNEEANIKNILGVINSFTHYYKFTLDGFVPVESK